jgi:DNA sulfur modification protein DndE
MQMNRIRVSDEVDQRLRSLKGKTGLTPNLLCRIGFCLSLNEPSIPNPKDYDEGTAREFNRYTLTGQWDNLFLALLKERCFLDGLPLPDCLEEQFRAHLNRGVLLLFQRVKHLGDLYRLVEESRLQENLK